MESNRAVVSLEPRKIEHRSVLKLVTTKSCGSDQRMSAAGAAPSSWVWRSSGCASSTARFPRGPRPKRLRRNQSGLRCKSDQPYGSTRTGRR